VTGGYPNRTVFWEGKARYEHKVKEGGHQSILSFGREGWRSVVTSFQFRMISYTRIECRHAGSQRKSTRFESTGSNRLGAQPGNPGSIGWMGFYRGSQHAARTLATAPSMVYPVQ
jgi:hypothetical protein